MYNHQTHPKTVALLEQVCKEAFQEFPALKAQLETGEPAAFQTIVDLAFLQLVTQEIDIPEAFTPYSEIIQKMRKAKDMNTQALKDKILADKDLKPDSAAHYKDIGKLRTDFERARPVVYATLMHNLQLEFG